MIQTPQNLFSLGCAMAQWVYPYDCIIPWPIAEELLAG